MYKLTENLFSDQGVVRVEKNIILEMPLESAASGSYMMVCHNMYFTVKERDHLQKWVENGGTALISSKDVDQNILKKPTPDEFLAEDEVKNILEDELLVPPADTLGAEATDEEYTEDSDKIETAEDLAEVIDSISGLGGLNRKNNIGITDTVADLAFVVDNSGQLGRKHRFNCPNKNVSLDYYWNGISQNFLDTNQQYRIEKLGYLKDSILNFVGIKYGKGQFLFHSSPIVFANYHLLRDEGKAYCQGMMAYLKPNGTLYWDESNKSSDIAMGLDGKRSKNILNTLLKEKALAYAWYLLMFMVVTYLFVGSKRRQRTIPILPQRTNTSLEFVETISDLHFAQRDYNKLSRQKMKHFLSHLRERYGVTIPVVHENGQLGVESQHIERIAALSEVPKEIIENIFNKYQNITTFEPIEQTLLDFHFAIEHFMKWKKS